jgi:flagellar biosynthesis protein FliQ
MNDQEVLYIIQQTLFVAFKLAGPMLIAGLVVGLVVGIFQSVTQIQEMTLTFIPKILAVAGVLILAMPWMLSTLLDFTHEIYRIAAGL